MRFAATWLAAATLAAPATPPAHAWAPDVRAARAYIATRPGNVSFSMRTAARTYAHNSWVQVPAASLMKPILMAAYLSRHDVAHRRLRSWERRLLAPMIRASHNAGANRVLGIVGVEGEKAVARRIGMRDFEPFTNVWGLSRTSARDQALLFWRLAHVIPRRHHAFAFPLLRTITRSQRWGIAQARPRGWKLWFKGGWGSGSGAVDHQAALLRRGDTRITLAITTTGNPSHEAGKQTLRGVARRLLRSL